MRGAPRHVRDADSRLAVVCPARRRAGISGPRTAQYLRRKLAAGQRAEIISSAEIFYDDALSHRRFGSSALTFN